MVMTMLHNRFRLTVLATAAITLASVAGPAAAQLRPHTGSGLYYRLGGGDPAARSNNSNQISARLGLNSALRLNYSCGKFDLGLSWGNLMNSFSQIGSQVTNAVKAGISALPLYILQRAQPGLYQLFQTYSAKADVMIGAALKSCEEMEAQIKAGGDPYNDWLQAAKGVDWKMNMTAANTDIVDVKKSINTSGGSSGVPWVGGAYAGGSGQAPVRVVKDIVAAGYNATLNTTVTAPDTIDYSLPSSPVALQQLVRNFKRAADAAQYATDVMGEVEVATCDGAACPAKSTSTGMGLAPKFEGEVPPLRQAMNNLLAAPVPDAANLDLVSAPGVTVSREVVEALKELPPTERAIATERLVREIAVAKTIDKALAIRNTMLTGMTEPNIYASVGVKEAQAKLAILNRLIEDFLFEGRVRKEMVSATALALVEGARGVKANSVTVQPGRAGDTRTVKDGGIKP